MSLTTTRKEGYIAYSTHTAYGGGSAKYGHSYDLEDIYLKGKKDGADDMRIELMKRGKALFELALKKASYVTSKLAETGKENNITIYDFFLKVEDWDCVRSLILVSIDDFTDDKIEVLYKVANELSDEMNSDDFNWDYSITYLSENINIDKIKSDGFSHIYENIPRPRKAQ